MKKLVGLILAGMALGSFNAWSAEDWRDDYKDDSSTDKKMEIRVKGEYLKPKLDEWWDSAYGGGVQGIIWVQPNFGFGIEAGIQSWKAVDDVYVMQVVYNQRFYAQDKGDMNIFPIGASALFNIPLGDKAKITLEGGIKYMFVQSDVEHIEEIPLGISGNNIIYDTYKDDVDIDNGMVGFIGADIDFDLGSGWRLFAGGGYQFDIMKGDIDTAGLKTENELAGAFVKGGIGYSF